MKVNKKKKVLVIVAHPDDETIWMGGTILENVGKWDLTIVCLCRKNDADRNPKFKKVCEMFNAKCFISDLDDFEEGSCKKVLDKEISDRIKKFSKRNYDLVFTHGENGEYGHVRHVQVHNVVEKMVNNKILKCDELFFFAYVLKGGRAVVDSGADKFINLNDIRMERKRSIIRETYGFEQESFEFKSANDQESFKKRKKRKNS